MSDLLWWAVAIGGYCFTYRLLCPVIRDRVLEAEDQVERGGAVVMTMVVCLIWPFALLAYVFVRFSSPSIKERENALIEREARIKQLERELGIGRKD